MLLGVPYALFFLLGAVPLIIFLHSIRPRGVKVSTTALFIWERVLRERPLATRLGWLLRKNLLLILQLLATILLIAALADPALLHFGAPAGDTVVVMDLTASMKAKGPAGMRFDAARQEFFSLVDGLPADRKMMLIGAGSETRLIVPYTADKRRLREAGRTLMPADTSGQVKDAILFAHAFLKKGSPDRVVVISDGAFTGAEEFIRPAPHLRFIKTTGGAENTGIVGLELRRQPDGSQRYEAMVQVRNFGFGTRRAGLTLALGETILAREEIALEAGGRRVFVYSYEGDPTGALTAKLDIDDDFATDNHAALALLATAPLQILYVGPGNPFLSNLLRYFPNSQVTAVERWEPDGPQRQGSEGIYNVIIFDRVEVPDLTEGNVILINTVAPNLPLSVQGEVRLPRINASLTKHPITAGLSLGDLHVEQSLRVAASGDGIVLARGAESPLLVAFERPKLRALFIGFDLMASDLPFRVAFPVLFHNAFEWFQPQRREFPADSVRAAAPFPIFVPPGDPDLEITMPSGRRERLQALSNPVVFSDTLETGVYSYKSASREGLFTVNLFDEEESDIRVRTDVATTPAAPAAQEQRVVEAGFSLWPFLLAAVLLLLVLELILALRMRLTLAPALIRVCAFAVLTVAWINPKIFQAADALDVILGIDLSRSVGQQGREKARELLET
ncbi:MAG: VWA domain-containing protein, partial [Deltaproteobacteria bacterium]|nr:VWA domain-containing protein [Deltaproteobacteria bacterium]